MGVMLHELVLKESGPHLFGHDPALKGITAPEGWPTAQLCLTLDVSDPAMRKLGLPFGGLKRLRLIHPFRYDQACKFTYVQPSDDVVEQLSYSDPGVFEGPSSRASAALFANAPSRSWPHDDFPDVFEPRRAVLSPVEQKNGQLLDNACIIGRKIATWQDYHPWAAGDQICQNCEATNQLVHFASIAARPVPGLLLWASTSVYVLFWMCRRCGAIMSHNEI